MALSVVHGYDIFGQEARDQVRASRKASAETLRTTPAYVWLFLAGLVFTVFSGHSEEMGLPLSLDRPLLLLAFVLLVLDPRIEKLRWRTVYLAMGAMLVWVLWSWWSSGQLTDTYKLFAFLDRVFMPFCMFVLGALAFSTPFRRMLLLRLSTLMGIYLGLTGIAERVAPALVFPRYILDVHARAAEWRAVGPFASAEAFGMACALTFFCALLTALWSKGYWRIIAVAGCTLSVVGTALSMTRSCWMGLLGGIFICGLLEPRARKYLPALVGAGVVLAGVALALLPQVREDMLLRLTTSDSLYDRVNTNEAALRIISSHPLEGIGWGNFVAQNVLWVRQADTYPVTTVTIEVHNVFLARAAETGIAGAVLWGLCVLLGPVMAVTARPRLPEMTAWKLLGMASLIIWVFPTMFSPNPYTTPNLLIWLFAGVAGRGILVRLPQPQPTPAARDDLPTPTKTSAFARERTQPRGSSVMTPSSWERLSTAAREGKVTP